MDRTTVDALLTGMLESAEGVSDLLFLSGKPPLIEVHGRLHDFPIDTPESVLTPALIEDLAGHIMNGSERLRLEFSNTGSCDCSYAIENLARFRVNIFKQNGRHAMVMRRLESSVPTLDKLGLPPVFREIVKEKNGIILVTGATGTGKTTTLAAMINELNRTEDIHIVTLEDPIEFYHSHERAAISQRELGKDFPNFADGLRAALRQAPKVILVGEIRDRETLEIAMTASETGHLVFSTLHTINAGQTISRILGMFDREDEQQLRQRLSETLRYVISQRLVTSLAGGRLLVTEIMGSSLRTRETIVYGESENKTFQEIIEAGSTLGWHSFDQQLLQTCEAGLVSDETAMLQCTNKGKMRRDLDLLQKKRGAATQETHSGLKLHMPDAVMPESVAASPAQNTRRFSITPRPK
ncbi:MAG TPA: PilT/PilU family type 4a pilus ATPase [Chthoniobacterales bacterium]|nr:PilT/PilU family type 4a pilus ATPase [Chthoniobacterales bacterium]